MIRGRRKKRNLETPRAMSARDLGEAVSFPGIDPRTWVSYGVVDSDDAVDFDDDLGPLVPVTLQPSQAPAYCRVMGQIAGDGEAEYHPFVGGDEVVVLLPHGRPDADPLVAGRMNNTRQKWPKTVGGQDATKNTFGFRRARTPRVEELAGPILWRQSPSGAFVSIDSNGVVSIRDASMGTLQLSPDVFGYQDGGNPPKHAFQIDLSGDRAMLQVADARLILAGSSAAPPGSSLTVPDLLTVTTLKQPAAEHVLTTEALANVLAQWSIVLVAALGSTYGTAVAAACTGVTTPSPGSPLTPLGPALAGAMAAALAAGFDPSGSVLGAAFAAAAESPLLPTVAAAIFAAFSAPAQKPPGVPGQGQLLPGLGAAGFHVG